MKLVNEVTIYEVGLRDGLQLESKVLTVSEKLDIFNLLRKAKLSEIEFGSFVHPKLVPQRQTLRISTAALNNVKQK